MSLLHKEPHGKFSAKAVMRIKPRFKPDILLKVLKPETESPVSPRSKTQIDLNREEVVLVFKAKDTSALRASISAYGRWISAIDECIEVLSKQRSRKA